MIAHVSASVNGGAPWIVVMAVRTRNQTVAQLAAPTWIPPKW